jgi:hypothetical protein
MVGSTGLNLQHACSDQIMIGTTASDAQEQQALARIHRIGQQREVSALKLVVESSYGEARRLKRFWKVIASLVAHLEEDKLVGEGKISKWSREDDLRAEITTLWKELQGAHEMPSLPKWLSPNAEWLFSISDAEE